MDIKSPSKEVLKDLARESLIAISNLVPSNVLDNDISLPESFSGANVVAVRNGDVTEQYRSELISISYAQSPDAKVAQNH